MIIIEERSRLSRGQSFHHHHQSRRYTPLNDANTGISCDYNNSLRVRLKWTAATHDLCLVEAENRGIKISVII